MEINIEMSECHKNEDKYYGSNTVWIPRCAGREAFDGVEPLHGFDRFITSLKSDLKLLHGLYSLFSMSMGVYNTMTLFGNTHVIWFMSSNTQHLCQK